MDFGYVLVGAAVLGGITLLVLLGIEFGVVRRRIHMARATVLEKVRYPPMVGQGTRGNFMIGTTPCYPVYMPERYELTLSFAGTHDQAAVCKDMYDRCDGGALLWITYRDLLFGRKACRSIVCAPRG